MLYYNGECHEIDRQCDTQHNGIHHYNTTRYFAYTILKIMKLDTVCGNTKTLVFYYYADCHHTECIVFYCYAECHCTNK